jgi:hypothetical protein
MTGNEFQYSKDLESTQRQVTGRRGDFFSRRIDKTKSNGQLKITKWMIDGNDDDDSDFEEKGSDSRRGRGKGRGKGRGRAGRGKSEREKSGSSTASSSSFVSSSSFFCISPSLSSSSSSMVCPSSPSSLSTSLLSSVASVDFDKPSLTSSDNPFSSSSLSFSSCPSSSSMAVPDLSLLTPCSTLLSSSTSTNEFLSSSSLQSCDESKKRKRILHPESTEIIWVDDEQVDGREMPRFRSAEKMDDRWRKKMEQLKFMGFEESEILRVSREYERERLGTVEMEEDMEMIIEKLLRRKE